MVLSSNNLQKSFREYYADVRDLDMFTVRRRYSKFDRIDCAQLFGFCDASEKAYCVVVYFRRIDEFENIDACIICSKTRVAPLRSNKLTVPKFEL